MMRKCFALLIVLVMVCLGVPMCATAEVSGWRVLDSQQNGDSLEVWFVTDEQISAGEVIYTYGGVTLQETDFSTMEGVGYIFIVDNTALYSDAAKINPKDIVAGAVSKMSPWDSVAFVGVTLPSLEKETKFVAKASWEEQYDEVLGTGKRPYYPEYVWEAVSKATSFARDSYQNKVTREIVMILITDGSVGAKNRDGTSCKSEIEKLPFSLPFYCLHLLPKHDDAKLKDFAESLERGTVLSVVKQNTTVSAQECVTPYSNLIYKSTLHMGPEIYNARDDTLAVNLAGSQKSAVQEGVTLNWNLIPTPTPEPTATPEPTPTPEVNPQYVGDGVGAEHDIWELQRVLIHLGFLETENPTGVWDPSTTAALNLYYRMNDIGSDQIPKRGGMTREAYDTLMAAAETGTVITPTPVPTEAPTPEPTATPTIDPNKGQYIGYETEDKSLIRTLNKALKEKYYLDQDVEGSIYGDATEEAVGEFYKDHPELSRPEAGEGISRAAYEALLTAKPKETPVPTEAPTEDPHPAYIDYETTNVNLISELNRKLTEKFYVSNPNAIVEEIYNEATNEGIRNFYQFNSDKIDAGEIFRPSTGAGITKEAYEFLCGPDSKAMPTATPIPDLRFTYEDDWMQSADGAKVENRLVELGYLQEGGNRTSDEVRKAIFLFEERNGLPTLDEYLDNQTYQTMMSTDARPKEDPPEEIAPGAKEPAKQIKDFQDALKKNGYFRDVQGSMRQGTFDEATQEAYKRFAQVNDIQWDGGPVSWESQRTVLNSEKENPPLDLFEGTKSFVTGSYEVFGLKVPVWALVAILLLIVVAAVIAVIILAKGRKKKNGTDAGYELPAYEGPNVISGADEPTAELSDSGISTGADAPTADPEGCVITLMITGPNGMSQDTTYNLGDGDQLVIGRGSDADIVTDTADTLVSRKHGILRYNARRLFYEDQSRHNTIVDGNVLSNETVELHQGSQLELGRTIIKVQWS